MIRFLTRRRGGRGWHWTDIVTWLWLVGGLVIMFGPAVWLVGSSFKTPAQLSEFPPTILPYVSQQTSVEGYDKPLTLYTVKLPDGHRSNSICHSASVSSCAALASSTM